MNPVIRRAGKRRSPTNCSVCYEAATRPAATSPALPGTRSARPTRSISSAEDDSASGALRHMTYTKATFSTARDDLAILLWDAPGGSYNPTATFCGLAAQPVRTLCGLENSRVTTPRTKYSTVFGLMPAGTAISSFKEPR